MKETLNRTVEFGADICVKLTVLETTGETDTYLSSVSLRFSPGITRKGWLSSMLPPFTGSSVEDALDDLRDVAKCLGEAIAWLEDYAQRR